MLQGRSIQLRPVREADLDAMYAAHVNIASRGEYFPRGVMSEPAFRGEFAESGFWKPDSGTLLIVTPEDEMAGHMEFFRAVSYWDAYELSYQLYGDEFAGRGYATEAVQLTVDYLFAVKQRFRIHLVIHPENVASIRIAEKCGFVLEGTIRGAFFNQGRNNDVLMYSLVRSDPRAWEGSDAEAKWTRRSGG